MLRRIGTALILFGVIGLWAYPVWFGTYYNVELGTYRVYDADGGFRSLPTVPLSPAAVPLEIDLSGRAEEAGGAGQPPNLTLVINGPERTAFAEVIDLQRAEGRGEAALAAEIVVRGSLEDGPHRFVFGPGDRDGAQIAFMDMTLTAAVSAPDGRVAPVSWGLLALGVAMVVLPLFRRRRRTRSAEGGKPARGRRKTSNIGRGVPLERDARKAAKPKRRWGRGDDRG